ncbi:MAG: hypothetical protein AMXMBFR7_26310 [Planctomycetota bacterium]
MEPDLYPLTDRELATVLAALNYWANDLDDPSVAGELHSEVAADGGKHEPLDQEEVHALIERLNEGA